MGQLSEAVREWRRQRQRRLPGEDLLLRLLGQPLEKDDEPLREPGCA